MNIRRTVQFICFALIFSAIPFPSAAEDFTNAIQAFLQHRGEVEGTDGAIVVGILDEHGGSIVSYGKLDNGTDRPVNGDTVFGIYSGTCLFTGLLLEDMVARGEMMMDDPVAKYLPKTVKMPTFNGQQITLRDLLTETSGLPSFYQNQDPKRAESPFADFTPEQLYAGLSGCRLTVEPGLVYAHGGVAMGLLGLAIALRAGTNYESLVVNRICRPLQMDSTRGTLTPELKSRLALDHPSHNGFAVADDDWGLMMPLGGLHSTANDLLKFVSANLGFTSSSLPPLLDKCVALFPAKLKLEKDRGIVEFGGGNMFAGQYAIFDKIRRRGAVVLTSSGSGLYTGKQIGRLLLESEWQSDRRPRATHINSQDFGAYAGQYQRSPDFALGIFSMRQWFLSAPKTAVCITVGFSLAALLTLVWCAGRSGKRWTILACAMLAGGALASLTPLVFSHVFCARYQPRINIRSQGDHLFAQGTGIELWPIEDWANARPGTHPIDELWPPLPLELLAQSETRFFERLSGMPLTFTRDGRGRVTRLTVQDHGAAFSYERISDQAPKLPEPLKRPVAIKLDPKLLDACIGRYQQPPSAQYPTGAKVTIRREGDQLICRISGQNAPKGATEIYPASETNFFDKLVGVHTFLKNAKGEVTAVITRVEGFPEINAKKLKNGPP